MGKEIKVVIVDDSAFMRKSLSMMLESDPQIKVVATARDGKEGIEKIKEYNPDIVTMDVEMPGMDGLTALKIIMKESPLPVLMISSLTSEGAQTTLDALNLGAVDFIPKELSYVSLDIAKIKEDLIAKVRHIVQSRGIQFRLQRIRSSHGKTQPPPQKKVQKSINVLPSKKLSAVVIGISTGGPSALLEVIPKLPAGFPIGIAIVQHMPPKFTASLAERLNGLSSLEVREAEDGDRVQPGVVLLAPGGQHMTFRRNGGGVIVRIDVEPMNTLYRPSADIMMTSAVEEFDGPLLGVIMTGMGKDGLEGLKRIKAKNGYVVAQDEESCVVYGMPKVVVDEGLADSVVNLDDMASTLTRAAKHGR